MNFRSAFVVALFLVSADAFACKEELQFKDVATCEGNHAQILAFTQKLNEKYANPTRSGGRAPLSFGQCKKYTFCRVTCGYISVEISDLQANGQMYPVGTGCAALLNEIRAKGYYDKIVPVVEEGKDARSRPAPVQPFQPAAGTRAEDAKAL